MGRTWKTWSVGAALVLLAGVLQPAEAAVGFRVSGRNLVERNGSNFIIRGISHAHTWYPTQTSSFANIKAAGANTVRVVLSSGHRWTQNSASDVANVIQLCKTNRLICMLEVHDTTGFGEDGAAQSLAGAVAYWQSIQSVLTGQEDYVLINIGNEPYGNNNASAWIQATTSAITQMRAAGFDHTLIVDAPNWGQDWQFNMRDNAASIFAADPDRNTVFSIHMYGVFDTAAEVTSYVSTFVSAGLPLIIGEFGHNHSDGNPDEDAIMATAQSSGIGYMGWSWSGNGGGVEYLDMVTAFNPAQRTSWGTRLFTGANGLSTTSREATIFSGSTPTPTNRPTATPTTRPTPTPTATATPTTRPTATPTGRPTVTPTPSSSTVYQAESGTLGGGTTVDTNHSGFAGTGFLNFPANGGFVQLSNVSGGSGGGATLRIRFALGASGSRTGQLQVNGGTAQNITFASTGAWTTWVTMDVATTLTGGTGNTVRLQSTGQDLGNVDQIEVLTGSGTPTPTPTATARPTATPTSSTPTPTSATPTPTPTSTGTACANPTTVSMPITIDGTGDFCRFTTGTIGFINSWNTQLVTVNGVAFTNQWSNTLPARVDGGYYIRYVSTVAWGHFEAR